MSFKQLRIIYAALLLCGNYIFCAEQPLLESNTKCRESALIYMDGRSVHPGSELVEKDGYFKLKRDGSGKTKAVLQAFVTKEELRFQTFPSGYTLDADVSNYGCIVAKMRDELVHKNKSLIFYWSDGQEHKLQTDSPAKVLGFSKDKKLVLLKEDGWIKSCLLNKKNDNKYALTSLVHVDQKAAVIASSKLDFLAIKTRNFECNNGKMRKLNTNKLAFFKWSKEKREYAPFDFPAAESVRLIRDIKCDEDKCVFIGHDGVIEIHNFSNNKVYSYEDTKNLCTTINTKICSNEDDVYCCVWDWTDAGKNIFTQSSKLHLVRIDKNNQSEKMAIDYTDIEALKSHKQVEIKNITCDNEGNIYLMVEIDHMVSQPKRKIIRLFAPKA